MRRLLVRGVLLAALSIALLAGAAPSAMAQAGRIVGTVRDDRGQPIKGATVTADNPDASPSSFTATSDDKGRFGMIGLKSGAWTLIASAPGYTAQSSEMNVRQSAASNAPAVFVLKKVQAPPSALGSVAV